MDDIVIKESVNIINQTYYVKKIIGHVEFNILSFKNTILTIDRCKIIYNKEDAKFRKLK